MITSISKGRRTTLLTLAAAVASMLAAMAAGCGGGGSNSAGLATAAAPPGAVTADAVYTNAKVLTVDASDTVAEAFAVKDGRFLAVGSQSELNSYIGANTAVVDLGKRTVVPGLGDGHLHDVGGGPGIDVSQVRSIAQMLATISMAVAKAQPGELLISNPDWYHGQLDERRMPTRAELDSVAPNNPLVLLRGGLTAVLNSAALSKFNITESTVSPQGGIIEKDVNGHLTGVLINAARSLMTLPPDPPFDSTRMQAFQQKLNALGVTSVRIPGAFTGTKVPAAYKLIRQLQNEGKLTLRFDMLLDSRVGTAQDVQQISDAADMPPGSGDDWARVWGAKTYVDGGFEGGFMTEAFEEPYGQHGTYFGLPLFTADQHEAVVSAWAQRKYRVAVHVVGDAALDQVLTSWEKLDKASPGIVKGWVIEHALVARSDQIPRIKALGVQLSLQPHLYYAAPILAGLWGRARADVVVRTKEFSDAGFEVAGGSDSPLVLNPFLTMYHFVVRDTVNDGIYGASERISRPAALRMFTSNFAKLNNEQDIKGSIEKGKLADFAVLTSDYLTIPDAQIKTLTPVATYVGGREVYRNNAVTFGQHLGRQ
ncbi:amidohydrolase [Variovorax ureilyticus]|uniref:Amidohydrolase n=1 Tax=Variovorax ureilyticus TaxID=1836198 RepID=A0ABU8VQQ3_9BURK